MNNRHPGLVFRFLYSMYFYAVFLTAAHCFFWYGIIRYGHYRTTKKIDVWRHLALHLIDTIFFLCAIRIRANGRENIPDGPVIFAANHQSYLDGLIIFYIIRKPFTAVTGPFGIFPRIIRGWFEHMGYVSVGRDVFETLRYKSTLHHKQAITACVRILKKGTALLIFPEGRREFKKKLLPFHCGVAKIALSARVPVVPIALEHVDVVFPGKRMLLCPARMGVRIMPPIALWKISSNTLKDAVYIENVIQKHLPASYFSEQSIPHLPAGIRAAFFDIDNTLTRKNVYQEAVLVYLVRHFNVSNIGKIPQLIAKHILLSHGKFYLAALRMLKGISANEFTKGFFEHLRTNKEKIFYREMLALIEEHRNLGNKIFLITEEPEEIIIPIAKLLDVQFCATVVEKKCGIFTGRIVGHIMKDEHKRDCIIELAKKHNLDLDKSYAYGDSEHDYAMLRSVGHAALVSPKKALAEKGKRLGFRIIHEK